MTLEVKRLSLTIRSAARSLICFIAALLLAAGCHKNNPKDIPIVLTGFSMGTSYTIKIARSSNPGNPEEIPKKIKALLSTIDSRMSTYLPDSEVSRFNDYRQSDWFEISPQTLDVLAEAIRISRLSHGAFDITVGGLVELWGFGKKERQPVVPSELAIRELLERVGYDKIMTRKTTPAIRKTQPNVTIDLSAIAKGYAVDRVALMLLDSGIKDFLVEIGGEIRTSGFKKQKMPWRVAIERPLSGARSVYKVVSLTDQAMATSGDYRNYFDKGGMRYSHTIDPKTGKPVKHQLTSVTVVHKSCMTADALATALMVLGPEKGYSLAEENGLAAFFIYRGKEKLTEKSTTAFSILFD